MIDLIDLKTDYMRAKNAYLKARALNETSKALAYLKCMIKIDGLMQTKGA